MKIADVMRPSVLGLSGDTASPRAGTVLHIVRNMGGGLEAAIADHMASTPEWDHVLLRDVESGCELGQAFDVNVRCLILPRAAGPAIRTIRSVVDDIDPDVVHLHSSFAGAYARVGLPRRYLSRVVYTPHCFSFCRRDIGWLTRAFYWLVEAALALRAPRIAACSPQETVLARKLPRAQVSYVPNVTHWVERPGPPHRAVEWSSPTLVAVGRLCAQKSPDLFAEAAQLAARRGAAARWIWIGGGDPELRRRLEAAGVYVTGWRTRGEVLNLLGRADAYIHTASWEGAPLTVLEAVGLGVPVFARRTPAMECLGLEPLWRDPCDLVDTLLTKRSAQALSVARDNGAELRLRHTAKHQRQPLLRVYKEARSCASNAQSPDLVVAAVGQVAGYFRRTTPSHL